MAKKSTYNAKDIEAIKALNSNEISVFGPAGEVIEGSDAHIEFLTHRATHKIP